MGFRRVTLLEHKRFLYESTLMDSVDMGGLFMLHGGLYNWYYNYRQQNIRKNQEAKITKLI